MFFFHPWISNLSIILWRLFYRGFIEGCWGFPGCSKNISEMLTYSGQDKVRNSKGWSMKNTIIVKDIDLFYRPYFNDKIIYMFRTFNLCAMKFMEKRSSTQFVLLLKGAFLKRVIMLRKQQKDVVNRVGLLLLLLFSSSSCRYSEELYFPATWYRKCF